MEKNNRDNATGRQAMRLWIFVAALNGFMGVAAGAIGSHLVAPRIPANQFHFFDMAADYQLWHALGLLGVGLMSPYVYQLRGQRLLNGAGVAFLTGTIMFSGALYYLALAGTSLVHWLAPVGGAFLIAGWLALSASAWYIENRK